MTRLTAVLAPLVALSLASPTIADAKCARGGLKPEVVTKDVAAPAGGGVLVTTKGASWNEKDVGDANQPTWRFRIAGKLVAPTIEALAPGLAVYKLPAKATAGELTDGKATIGKLRITADKTPVLAAPLVKAIHHYDAGDRFRGAETTVELDGAAPAGAVAIVIADDKGKAESFGLVTDEPLTVYSHGHCTILPNGTVEPSVGQKATLFFVDKLGRKSPLSKVVTITAAPVPPAQP